MTKIYRAMPLISASRTVNLMPSSSPPKWLSQAIYDNDPAHLYSIITLKWLPSTICDKLYIHHPSIITTQAFEMSPWSNLPSITWLMNCLHGASPSCNMQLSNDKYHCCVKILLYQQLGFEKKPIYTFLLIFGNHNITLSSMWRETNWWFYPHSHYWFHLRFSIYTYICQYCFKKAQEIYNL